MATNFHRFRKGLLILFLVIATSLGAQVSKFDRGFRQLMRMSPTALQNEKGLNEIGLLQVKRNVANPSTPKFSAIIETRHVEDLRARGIEVQSVLPNYVTAIVSLADLKILEELSSVKAVSTPRIVKLSNEIARAKSGASLVHAGVLNNTSYTGSGVLVGVLDTGIDWEHPDFRGADDQTKSRILRMWDQTDDNGTGPSGFGYGREYTKADIEADLSGAAPGSVKEKDVNGHGTHVASIAAGNGAALPNKKFMGMAPDAELIIVKGGNNGVSQAHIIDALNYFAQVATEENKPIVVNISLGTHFSSHDGRGAQDEAVDAFTNSAPGRVVAAAAGNENGEDIHIGKVIPAGGSETITLKAKGDSTTETDIIDLLLFSDQSENFEVTVTAPTGETYTATGGTIDSEPLGTDFIVEGGIYLQPGSLNRWAEIYVGRVQDGSAQIKGDWTVEIHNLGTQDIQIHGWLADAISSTYTGEYIVSVVGGDSNYLVGSPGSALSAITVGAYSGRGTYWAPAQAGGLAYANVIDALASFSSKGPLRTGVLKPEIAATGHFVGAALPSNLVDSEKDYMLDEHYYIPNSGTSMASPVVAGAAALLLQMNPALTYQQVKDAITQNAQMDVDPGEALPNPSWGYGKVDVFKAGASVLGLNALWETYTHEPIPYFNNDVESFLVGTKRLAVRFTPTISGKIGGFYIHSYTKAQNVNTYTVEVRADAAGKPGALLGQTSIPMLDMDIFTWNYFDLSGLDIPVQAGTDFHLVIYSPDASAGWTVAAAREVTTPGDSVNLSSNQGTSWDADGKTLRMRAVVYGGDYLLGTEETATADLGIKVYPNPAVDVVHISRKENGESQLRIYDLSGKVVKAVTLKNKEEQVDVQGLTSGMYILNFKSGAESFNFKLIKK